MNVTRFKFGEQQAINEAYAKMLKSASKAKPLNESDNNDEYADDIPVAEQLRMITSPDNWKTLWNAVTGKYGDDAAKQIRGDFVKDMGDRAARLGKNTWNGAKNMVMNPGETFGGAKDDLLAKTAGALSGAKEMVLHPVRTWGEIKKDPYEFAANVIPFSKLGTKKGMDNFSLGDMISNTAAVASMSPKGVQIGKFNVGGHAGKAANAVADTVKGIAKTGSEISNATSKLGTAGAIAKGAARTAWNVWNADMAAAMAAAPYASALRPEFADMIRGKFADEDVTDEERKTFLDHLKKTAESDKSWEEVYRNFQQAYDSMQAAKTENGGVVNTEGTEGTDGTGENASEKEAVLKWCEENGIDPSTLDMSEFDEEEADVENDGGEEAVDTEEVEDEEEKDLSSEKEAVLKWCEENGIDPSTLDMSEFDEEESDNEYVGTDDEDDDEEMNSSTEKELVLKWCEENGIDPSTLDMSEFE